MTVLAVSRSTDYSGALAARKAVALGKGTHRVKGTTAKADIWSACLVKIRDGQDAEAFARLFGHFAPRVKSFLIGKGAADGAAEEAMQEAMATVWFKAAQFDPARASAATWIFTIARNKYLDAIRKTNRPEPEEIDWEGCAPQEPVELLAASQEADLVRMAIAQLPEAQRVIVEKAYFGDLSHAQIAEVTGLPIGTIKSRIRLGLERLRKELSVLT